MIRSYKREAEFQSFVLINEAAVKIQKVTKSNQERGYLLRFLEDKYEKGMTEPSVKLQSVFRQARIQKQVKQDYFVQALRDKISKTIIKLQSLIRLKQAKKKAKLQYLIHHI